MLSRVVHGPGIGMVTPKQAPEGTTDLVLGCARVESQDGVQVGPLVTHGLARSGGCRVNGPGRPEVLMTAGTMTRGGVPDQPAR